MRPLLLALTLLALGGAPLHAAAGRDLRVTVLVDAGRGLQAPRFETTRTIREFAEDGRLDGRYAADGGPSFGGAVQVRLTRRLGVVIGGAHASRDQAGTWEAQLPHPLYLDRDRHAGGALSGRATETEVFAAASWVGSGDKLDVRLFAGPSFFAAVTTQTLREVVYTHAYPYDEVAVTGTVTGERDGSGLGLTAGAGLDYRLGARVGLGVQGRYSRATVSIQGDDVEPAFDLEAGGFTVSGGLRVRF